MANKAIRYRLYPNADQRIMFAKTFGCCRKVYNLMLNDKIESYKKTGKFVAVTPAMYKKDYPFLKEVDSLALANVQLNLQAAFRNHFDKSRKKQTGFPKFKSAKRSRKSYTTNNQKGTVAIIGNGIKLPKIGIVKAVIHRQPEADRIIKKYPTIDSLERCLSVAIEVALENKRAVLHLYNSVNRDLYEQYLMNVCDHVVTAYVNTTLNGREVREYDKQLLIRFFKCTCFGQTIEWMNGGMKEDIRIPFQRLCELSQGMSDEFFRRSMAADDVPEA